MTMARTKSCTPTRTPVARFAKTECPLNAKSHGATSPLPVRAGVAELVDAGDSKSSPHLTISLKNKRRVQLFLHRSRPELSGPCEEGCTINGRKTQTRRVLMSSKDRKLGLWAANGQLKGLG